MTGSCRSQTVQTHPENRSQYKAGFCWVFVVTAAVLTMGAYCPWNESTLGPCGRWTIIAPPGYCYVGERLPNGVCTSKSGGNGAYLHCQTATEPCVAYLREYAPSNDLPCARYTGTLVVSCGGDRTKVSAVVLCPSED